MENKKQWMRRLLDLTLIIRKAVSGNRIANAAYMPMKCSGAVFMDPQTGRYVDINAYMSQAVKSATKLVRIDNLKPTALLEKCVKKRSK